MIVVVAGSRDLCTEADEEYIFSVLDLNFGKSLNKIEYVISGMAKGPDLIGRKWAKSRGLRVVEMPAQWDLYGKSAGARRNVEMCILSTHVIIFYDGVSKGSKHMLDESVKRGKWVKLVTMDKSDGGKTGGEGGVAERPAPEEERNSTEDQDIFG